jgi:hypothetical protein
MGNFALFGKHGVTKMINYIVHKSYYDDMSEPSLLGDYDTLWQARDAIQNSDHECFYSITDEHGQSHSTSAKAVQL